MGYGIAIRIREDRINRSVEAAEKWLKGAEANEEKLAEAWEMLSRLGEAERKIPVTERYGTKESRLAFWALKVYNGMLYKVEKKLIWA